MQYLLNRRQINEKFSRWIVILQEYDLEFSTPKSRKALVLAEPVTTLPSDTTSTPINTDFPNEHLFYITSDDPWYSDLLASELKISVTTFHKMIIVVFSIRPPATSSSETSYTGGESTPFFIDA
jgi:hypothetical protein